MAIKKTVTKIKRRIVEKIDKKLDPQRIERQTFLKRYLEKSKKAGSPTAYFSVKLSKLRTRFYMFNDIISKKGANVSFKMADAKYMQNPKEIVDRKYGKQLDNHTLIEREMVKILRNEKNNKSKVQQLIGLKEEIQKLELHKQKFVSELNSESLKITDTIIELERNYVSAKERISLDTQTKANIETEINTWKKALGEIRAFTREINNQPIDIYLRQIDHHINILKSKKS